MNDTTTPLDEEEAKKHLTELVLAHFSIPRSRRAKDLEELESLLPVFIQMARHSWNAATTVLVLGTSRIDGDPSYSFLVDATERNSQSIEKLNNILEEIGVNDFLRDLAASPYVAALRILPVDPYEERLLKSAAHPNPAAVVPELLQNAAADPSLIASPSDKLDQAAQALLRAHEQLIVDKKTHEKPGPRVAAAAAKSAVPSPDTARPKRKKLFTGLGSLLSGIVLLAGDGIFIPSVVTTGGLAALPLIVSMASGIAAAGKGAGDLLREGE